MFLSKTAEFLLSAMLTFSGAGKSPYSMEELPHCGTSPSNPICELKPQCNRPGDFRCKKPRWSKHRKVWVQAESRPVAALRLRRAAVALDSSIDELLTCRTSEGERMAGCRPLSWRGTPEFLKLLVLTVSYWESGYREDIMSGAGPRGRGMAGEVCLMQVKPHLIRRFSPWMTPPQRNLTDEHLAEMLVGTDIPSLRRCYKTGAVMVSKQWNSTPSQCPGHDRSVATFALYATGSACSTVGNKYGDFAVKRANWLGRRKYALKHGYSIPKWAQSVFQQHSSE